MKRELALQLLKTILPDPPWSEDALREVFEDLHTLAEHKYNRYEMYQPARLFFESLYLFLAKFKEEDRTTVLEFVRNDLLYISREEFQQLAHVLYFDRIRQKQLDFAAELSGIARHRLRALSESEAFRNLQRASLYIALSDGARIDYFRRQNLEISNEQVLAAYYVGDEKIADVQRSLTEALQDVSAKFDCLFLLDDFCGSGRTLLREVVIVRMHTHIEGLKVPPHLRGRLKYDEAKSSLEWTYAGSISGPDLEQLRKLSSAQEFQKTIDSLSKKCAARETKIKGSLLRIAEQHHALLALLSERARIYLTPLLSIEYAISRLQPLLACLPEPLNRLELLPAAVIPNEVRITNKDGPIGKLCEDYYVAERLEDEHTSNVKFGYDGCGLPLILHHNTPNNSLYFFWARKWGDPLFVRYERHGREVRL
jgi:hypothetical protein